MDKKKMIIILHLVLFACLIILYGFVTITALAAPNQNEIIDKMLDYCEIELNIKKENLILNNIAQSDDGSWAISFFVKNADPTTNGLVIGEVKRDGSLLSIEGPSNISLKDQLSNALRVAQFSYQDMYQFAQEWRMKLDSLKDSDVEELRQGKKKKTVVDLIYHSIVLPDEKCISYEDAVNKSIEAIKEVPGWNNEMTELIDIGLEIVHIPDGGERPVYQFIYNRASHVYHIKSSIAQETYTNAKVKEYENLSKAEKKVFNNNMLRKISVCIDAYTGELVGDIYMEFSKDSVRTSDIELILND
ncbi:MAG: hypothetical protein IKZ98_07980 [Clostridia bacterium]|nr:hypothetical protein [Clostridia bacterium]